MSLWVRSFAIALLITSSMTACTGGEPTPVSQDESTSTADTTSGPDGTSSPSPGGSSLRDPMLDLIDSEGAADIGKNQPVITQRGNQRGEFPMPKAGVAGDAVVAVACEAGAGRFTVESDDELVLSSPCTGRATATIRLAGSAFGTTVSVTAPSDFWLVVVPTA